MATPSQSGPVSDGSEGELGIHQSSSITEASQSDCVVSYTLVVGESYSSTEIQLVYFIAPVNWARKYNDRYSPIFWHKITQDGLTCC